MISIAVILHIRLPLKIKFLNIGLIILLIGGFIIYTQYNYRLKTKTLQYSAFGGWQIAANALYGYAYATPDPPTLLPKKFQSLHIVVNRHIDSLRHLATRPDEEIGVYYLWDGRSPLKAYMEYQWKGDSTTEYFNRWSSMAPLYSAYGWYLIWHHPAPFIKHFLWPNLARYYAPPTQFMGRYNLGNETVDPIIASWFGWKSNKLITRNKDTYISIVSPFPIILSIINPVFALGFITFIFLSGFRKCTPKSKSVILLMLIVWFFNLIFSVFSAPIELRYQIFPMILTLSLVVFLFEFCIKDILNIDRNKVKDLNTRGINDRNSYSL
jgi:hypothetical protein